MHGPYRDRKLPAVKDLAQIVVSINGRIDYYHHRLLCVTLMKIYDVFEQHHQHVKVLV